MDVLDRSLRLRPPAKVNLILKIFDRLPNGYHALWSLMQTVGVTDVLTIRVTNSFAGVRVVCSGDSPSAPTDNLVYRAAQLVLQRVQASVGVELTLDKRIPVAAGLGGGSSDAAATIMGLNRLLDVGWSNRDMAALGQTLGSDVPFFFDAPTAVVRGWGERIFPKTLHDVRWMVLANPGFPIKTGQAFQRLDERRPGRASLPESLRVFEHASTLAWPQILASMQNDFEAVLFDDYPALAALKHALLELGAEGALLSGSGATVVGVFRDQAGAQRAEKALADTSGAQVWLGSSLRHGVLPP